MFGKNYNKKYTILLVTMGSQQTTTKCNFEDVQRIISSDLNDGILINTLDRIDQECLIERTITIQREEKIVNELLNNMPDMTIIVYGRNNNDDTIYKKYNQLIQLGFKNVFIYTGGMFEWLALQDIYGNDEFPTTSVEIDILRFKPISVFQQKLLKNN